MNEIRVNNLQLPHLLIELVKRGYWKRHRVGTQIPNLPIEDVDDLSFFKFDEMQSNTNELLYWVTLADGTADLFQLVDGDKTTVKEGFLDVSKAVMIAATRGEEFICLDYSKGGDPRIVATSYADKGIKWLEIAHNIEDFAKMIGLPPLSSNTDS